MVGMASLLKKDIYIACAPGKDAWTLVKPVIKAYGPPITLACDQEISLNAVPFRGHFQAILPISDITHLAHNVKAAPESLLVEAATYRHDNPGPISYRSAMEIEPSGCAGAVGPKKAILQRAALDNMAVDTILNPEEQPKPRSSHSDQYNDTSACSIVIGPKKAMIEKFNSINQSSTSVITDDSSKKTGSHTKSILAKMSTYDSSITLEDHIVSDMFTESSYSTTSYGSQCAESNQSIIHPSSDSRLGGKNLMKIDKMTV